MALREAAAGESAAAAGGAADAGQGGVRRPVIPSLLSGAPRSAVRACVVEGRAVERHGRCQTCVRRDVEVSVARRRAVVGVTAERRRVGRSADVPRLEDSPRAALESPPCPDCEPLRSRAVRVVANPSLAYSRVGPRLMWISELVAGGGM